MKLLLERCGFGPKATIGNFFVDGEQFCWSLEDVDRHLELDPSAKIYGQSAIPRGTYDVVFSFSPHFGRDMPHLVNVPGFKYVMIHRGNTDADTEGCILVGGKPLGPDFIPHSREHFEALVRAMEEAEEHGESITIEVR